LVTIKETALQISITLPPPIPVIEEGKPVTRIWSRSSSTCLVVGS